MKNAQKKKKHTARNILFLIFIILLTGMAVLYFTGTLSKWISALSTKTLQASDKVQSLDPDAYTMTKMSGELFLRCNHAGLMAMKEDGSVAWDALFDMKSPYLEVAGDYSAVADLKGREAIVFDQGGERYRVTGTYSIVTHSVNERGYLVLALSDDQNTNYIEVYSPEGKKILSRQTFINKDGIVLAAVLSLDASRLITSYYRYYGSDSGSVLTAFDLSPSGDGLKDKIFSVLNIPGEMVTDLSPSKKGFFYASESTLGFLTADNTLAVLWAKQMGREMSALCFGTQTAGVVYQSARIGFKQMGPAGFYLFSESGAQIQHIAGDEFTTLSVSRAGYVVGDGNHFISVSEAGLRQWQATLAVHYDSMYTFYYPKQKHVYAGNSVVGRGETVLQYYTVSNKEEQ